MESTGKGTFSVKKLYVKGLRGWTYKFSKLIILSTVITIPLDSADIVRRKFMLVTLMTY